jgi:capsular polysaccharide transport system ATP-binding protein
LSGAQNARFVARIYGVDTDALIDFVAETARLGTEFHNPFRTYSAGMKARLAFAISMGIDFDTYLIDEVTSVGDAAFRSQSEDLLADRLTSRGAIVVSHSLGPLQRMCDAAIVIELGQATWFDDVGDAVARHRRNLAVG